MVFYAITIYLPKQAQALGGGASSIGPRDCNYERHLADTNCTCAINQCRLSIFDETLWLSWRNKPGQPTKTYYSCFGEGQVVDVSKPPFSQYSYQYYIDRLGLTEESAATLPGAAMDVFNNNMNSQMIPNGSVCKVVGNVAYWYYKPYFDNVMMGGKYIPGAKCDRPILVTRDLFGNNVEGVSTFFGCIPVSVNGLVAFVLRIGLGLGTFVTILIVLINLIKIISTSTNPEVVTASRKKMFSAVFSLLLLYLSLTFLSLAGLQILDLGSAGGSLLRLFTGG